MSARKSVRGFTLVEILIVVIILAILAVIVIPQFANASGAARRAALSDQLQTLRVQIQLFTLQHGDTKPAITGADWTPLTTLTVYKGENRGPYLPSIPRNTLNGFSDIAVVAAEPTFGAAVAGANIGFVYFPTNGSIYATNTAGDKVYNEANPDDPAN